MTTENNIVLASKKLSPLQIALVASTAAGSLIASRYLSGRKISSAQRLAESLLDTEKLREGARSLPDSSEVVLAACAGYLLQFARRSSDGLGLSSGADDPIGFSRTQAHPYSRATATVLTGEPEGDYKQALTYAVTIPEIGEVRGMRRVGGLHLSGLSPARPVPDTLQIMLQDGYTAQIEAEWQLTEALVNGRAHLFGSAALRDNSGNAGHLYVSYDGLISGTITRDARIIGRFEGKTREGLRFKHYQIER